MTRPTIETLRESVFQQGRSMPNAEQFRLCPDSFGDSAEITRKS